MRQAQARVASVRTPRVIPSGAYLQIANRTEPLSASQSAVFCVTSADAPRPSGMAARAEARTGIAAGAHEKLAADTVYDPKPCAVCPQTRGMFLGLQHTGETRIAE